MTHETVPADIAAALDKMTRIAAALAQAHASDRAAIARAYDSARAEADAVILKHLRACDEMKAALERIEQGV